MFSGASLRSSREGGGYAPEKMNPHARATHARHYQRPLGVVAKLSAEPLAVCEIGRIERST